MKPLRWSDLKWMGRSPRHFRFYQDNPMPQSRAMLFGSAVHKILFDQPDKPVVWEGERRGKLWQRFKENNPGEIITQDEHIRATSAARAVLESPAAPYLVGMQESRLDWEMAGVPCVGTPDVVGDDFISDLKVTDANVSRLGWHARRMLWNAQLSWYENAVSLVRGCEPGFSLVIIAVEPNPPHGVSWIKLPDHAVNDGHRIWTNFFEQYQMCMASGEWPGYGEAAWPDSLEELTITIDGEEI